MNVKAQESCGHASTFGSATHVPPARGCCMVLPCSLRSAREGACMRGRWSRLTAETHGLLKLFTRSYDVSDFYLRSTRSQEKLPCLVVLSMPLCVCVCVRDFFYDSTGTGVCLKVSIVRRVCLCVRVVWKCVLVLMQVCMIARVCLIRERVRLWMWPKIECVPERVRECECKT